MAYPIFRAESRERFEQLLKNDLRNGPITEFLSAAPEKADQDLREVLTSGLFAWQDKEYISRWLRDGEGNTKIAKRLSELYSGRVETMDLATGDIADYRTFTTSVEVEILDHEERKLATLAYRWDGLAPLLRGMYVKELDGFFQDPEGFADRHTSPLEGTPSYHVGDQVTLPAPDHPITGTIDAIEDTTVRIYTGPYAWSYDVISREQFETWLRQDERNAGLFTQEEKETPAPEITSEPVTVYPGDKNGLPYDVVVERLRVDEPEPTPPEPAPSAEQADHQENTDQPRRTGQNFRITDDHLGEGGPRLKYQANITAIRLLKELEAAGQQASPEQQEVLSRYETFKTPPYLRDVIEVKYVPYTAEWQVTGKNSVGYNNVAAYTTYGTNRANAYKILEDSLNLRDVRIYDTVEDADGKERRVLNAKETTLAAQKQQAIREAFKDWIWKDPQRRQALVRQYNEEMNSTRPREYDGSHIVFGGMNPSITLREHQKNAIAHVLYGGNTLLAHEVGAGKTFEMVAAAMEAKRLGLCQKSLFVVPNHLTEQWASEFLRLYPSANILVTTKKDFEKHNRKKFCARIATGDYDAIIIGHSQFEKIPISKERQERLLREQIWEITEGISEVEASGGERFTVKQLERTKKSLEARLEKLQAEGRKDDVVTFEQLGVDRLFVDEAHNYKNLFLYTKMRNVAGLSTTDAQKSSDMFAKCRYMDEITGSRGVIFATGTPVSNSMTELYTMQRYLQYDRLQELGMAHFDCWASRFGETVTALELAPEGTGYRARTRFSKFFNLPELMNLFKEIADIKTADQLHLPTPEVEYHNIVAQPTEHQKEMVKALSERAAKVHGGSIDPREDNMLKITSDGRKLGLDQRIINPLLPDEPGTKVNQCVDNIMQIWRDGQADKLTQLVFCDISTPQASPARKVAKALDNPTLHALEDAVPLPELEPAFTVYEDIRQKLIAQGMPAEQIAFIHEANTEVRKG